MKGGIGFSHFPWRGFVLSLLWTLSLSIGAFLLIRGGDRSFPDDYSLVVEDRDGRFLKVYLNNREQWCVPLDSEEAIPDKLIRAVCLFEDQNFFRHPGIDPAAIIRALYLNLTTAKRVSGASTITMQVARLMKPRARTLPIKVLEMFEALRLELICSKDEILRFYLNHAPYGGNIVGVQAASLRYFGKSTTSLTWAEAALLAVLPNAPSLIRLDRGREELLEKRDRLLMRLGDRGYLDDDAYLLSVREPLPAGESPFPGFAPHLAERIRRGAQSGVVRTTLDSDIQQTVKDIVLFHSEALSRLGIYNAAAVVAETQSGKVRAYVGSQNFGDHEHNGQVDGVNAIRSTGSLLKPFLYALAMDEGFFLPRTFIKDVPSQFGSFSPKNPDLKYSGLVTVREALIRSLNIPAVRTLQDYGLQRFYRFLKSAGLNSLFRPAQDYGLTLVLGGAEASLFELAMLFRGLALNGVFSPLKLLEGEEAEESLPALISPGACYLVLEILKSLKRPGMEYYWESYAGSSPFAWKTGTSYGQKDGWAVGVSPDWTIGIWVGNFTGEGNANLKSSRCAGPILFDILRTLPGGEEEEWFKPPVDALKPVKLCLKTGFRAGPDCVETVYSLAPVRANPIPACPYHRSIFVTNDESFRVNSLCWVPGDYKKVPRLIYPPDVAQFMRERGQLVDSLPPFKPGCEGGESEKPVRILYPEEGALLWIPRDLDGEFQKVTLRAAHAETERIVYWYVDDVYQGKTQSSHSRSILLSKGWHSLELVDEGGSRVSRKFYVNIRD